MMKKFHWLIIGLLSIAMTGQATVDLPKIFADNMVLQRNKLIPIWGTAGSNEKIEVRFNRQVKATRADKKGKWIIRLEPEEAGGPYELIIKGKNTVTLKNVLVGEVWICSGQSNMEWTVGQSMNAKRESANANNPYIRHIKISKSISSLPEADFEAGKWTVCDSSTVKDFTGIGYFFARNIYNEIKVPIGLINASCGGTNIETWTSREAFENSEEFNEMISSMPRVNLDSIAKLRVDAVVRRIESLQGSSLLTNTDAFKEISFDDALWPELNQPQLWEQQSLGEIDGVVWLRKTITLHEIDITPHAQIELSVIDDQDITYINGVKVGSTNQWNAKRRYSVPPGVLKAGKNLIAIRVTDTGGGGGIYGEPGDMNLILGDSHIALSGKWKFQVESIQRETNVNSLPSLAFNAMINPLIPYAFQGVLWYQGESNAGRAYQYRKAFPLMINDWRKKWSAGDFPFYYVQLATFNNEGNSNEGCPWAELREAQTRTLEIPNTGMCVTTDIGNPTDIHPTNKQEVGRRLAVMALHNVYQKSEREYSGPVYKSMEVRGHDVIVSFTHTGSGLMTPDPYGYIKGFEVAGKDSVFHFAKASIQNNTVVLYSEKVTDPIAVHFGWMSNAIDCNLYNKEGFPAIPFRTDEWKNVTKDVKYKIDLGK